MTVDETGLDETVVDETGVDKLGINPVHEFWRSKVLTQSYFRLQMKYTLPGLCLWYKISSVCVNLRPRVITLPSSSNCSVTWHVITLSCTLSLVAWCQLSNITYLVTFFVPDDAPSSWALGCTSSILPNLPSDLLYKVLSVKHQVTFK